MVSDLKGQTLGKYQILERLGRGGMADVYKGYQPQLDRFVAIKLMHAHLAEDAQFTSRFQREAKSVAALRHPHIVQVFDFDMQDNMYYMVMEYIEGGRTLKEILTEASSRGERIPIRQALDIIAKLADALDYAHQRGMIHRDIKPSNVLLEDANRPVLSDFGIARLIGQTGLTASGAMIGTPAYMSPEQGRGEQADERSDIYALGIILYEMLTGHPPYDADTPYAVILKHINAPLASPRSLVPDLPSGAERVVLKSLAKAAEDRYQNAGEMRKALQTALSELDDATPTSAITPPGGTIAEGSTMVGVPSEEDQTLPMSASSVSTDLNATIQESIVAPKPKSASRLSIPLLVGGALLAVLVCGGIIAAALAASRNSRPPVADQPPTDERTEVPTQEQIDEVTISDQPTVSPEVQAILDQAHAKWDEGANDEAITIFEEALALDSHSIDALTSLALLQMGKNESETAKEFLDQVQALAPDDGFVQYAVGMFYWTQGDFYDATKAVEGFERSVEDCYDPWFCSDAYYQIAYLKAWTFGEYETALEAIQKAIEIQPDPYTKASFYDTSGDIRYYGLEDYEGAVSDFETAYSIDDSYWHLENAADFSARQGDYDRARGYYDILLTEQAGDPHFLIGKAFVDWLDGDSEAAYAGIDRALVFDPNMAGAHYLKGLLLLDDGDAEAALAELDIMRHTNPNDDGYWFYDFPFFTLDWGREIRYDFARATYQQGNIEEALVLVDEAINEYSGWPMPYMLKGDILAEQGDLAGAREAYLNALNVTSDDAIRNEIEQRLTALSTP